MEKSGAFYPAQSRQGLCSFVVSQCVKAGVSVDYAGIMVEKYFDLFERAFTHSSMDEVNNYEILEFIGDGILKGVLGQYIVRRFPELSMSEGKLSKVRRLLEKSKTLGNLADKQGFMNFIRITDELRYTKKSKVLEDVFEAFVGALAEAIDAYTLQGIGYKYAYTYITTLLDTVDIQTDKAHLDDPITRLNELYTVKKLEGDKVLGWKFPEYESKTLFLIIENGEPKVGPNMPEGLCIYHKPSFRTLVWYQQRWQHLDAVYKVFPDLLQRHSIPEEKVSAFPEMYQRVQYVHVYGYFHGRKEILAQSIGLNTKNAKKATANKALQILSSMGYRLINK